MTLLIRCRIRAFVAWMLPTLVIAAATARGQDEPPGGADPFGAGRAPAVAPKAVPSPAADTTAAAPPETDPLILAILQAKRTTPAQELQAAASLMQLKRPDLAKPILQQLLDANLDAEPLAQLQQQFGSALFLRLAITPELQPEGGAVAAAVRKAVTEFGQDPQRLAALVDQLGNTNESTVRAAMAQLVRGGGAAVPPLLQKLVQPASAGQQKVVEATLIALGDDAVDPLVAALQAPEVTVQTRAAEVLGRLQARRAAPALLAPAVADDGEASLRDAARQALESILGGVPSRQQAERYLVTRIDELLSGTLPGRPDEQNRILTWSWSPTASAPVSGLLSADDAAMTAAAAASRGLHRLAPDDAAHTTLWLATGLEVVQRQIGFDTPLPDGAAPVVAAATAAGPAVLTQVLLLARDKRLIGAALATLQILERITTSPDVQATGGHPTPLVLALADRDRRIRYGAARVLVKQDAHQPYPGSSYLPDVLGYLASSGGQPVVLIADPKTEYAQNLAGLLNNLGLATRIATTGSQLLRTATQDPDIAFVLLSDALPHPGYAELIQVLRHDARVGELPIGLIVRDLLDPGVQRLTERDPLTLAFALPLSDADMALETRRLLEVAGRSWLAPEQRIAQATFALDTMLHWAQHPDEYRAYDLLAHQQQIIGALDVPGLSSRAATLLGWLATPQAQLALVEFASQVTHTLADRQAAVQAFQHAVQQRRLLLTRKQVLRQYERYNGSRDLDPETQQILGAILDAMEGPTRNKESDGNRSSASP